MKLFPDIPRRTAARTVDEQRSSLSEDEVALFARLLEEHRDKLYRVAFRMVGILRMRGLAAGCADRSYRRLTIQRGTYFDKWLYRIIQHFIDRSGQKRVSYRISRRSRWIGEAALGRAGNSRLTGSGPIALRNTFDRANTKLWTAARIRMVLF